MLREIPHVRQIPGKPRRRWFSGSVFDLILWQDEGGDVLGFQLTYGKPVAERALTWRAGQGLHHAGVDDGEGRVGRHKSAPLLVADGSFDAAEVMEDFHRASREIDPTVVDFVLTVLREASSGG